MEEIKKLWEKFTDLFRAKAQAEVSEAELVGHQVLEAVVNRLDEIDQLLKANHWIFPNKVEGSSVAVADTDQAKTGPAITGNES